MHNYLLDIAQNGLKGKKRSSIYLFLACFLSVTFAVLNVSITGSLNRTREEQRYAMYGEWNVAVYSQEPLTAALQDKRIQSYGTAQVYGELLDDGETALTGIGTLDESLGRLGRLEVESGRFPTKDNEIAVEADVLSDLGYDYELGQTLTLRIMDKRLIDERRKAMDAGAGAKGNGLPAAGDNEMDEHRKAMDAGVGNSDNGLSAAAKEDGVIVKEYILCGVLREYTGLWDSGTSGAVLAGACITEQAAKEIGSPCSYQYFLSVEQEESHGLFQQLKKDYSNTVENTSAYGALAKEEYHYFNLALILMITIAAVIVIYSVQLKEQMRSIQLFRAIGATKKQLSSVIFYETMLILTPAALGGIAAGSLATWGALRILMEQSAGDFFVSIPAEVIIGILLLWFGAVFGVRFLIFRYSLRGRLSTQRDSEKSVRLLSQGDSLREQPSTRKRVFPGAGRRKRKMLGRLFLSSAGILAVIFSYMESLSPIYIDHLWSCVNSYTITSSVQGTQAVLATDAYTESIKSLPGIEKVVAWRQLSGTLEFVGIEENPFCSLLAAQPGTDGKSGGTEGGGLECSIFGVAEDNWDMFFQHVKGKVDQEKFRDGEAVLLYIPYNAKTGVELDGKLYQDFGVAPGDDITVTAYGRGELSESGSDLIPTENGNMPYEEYQKPVAISQEKAEVAGIITEDLMEEAYLNLAPHYYAVIASDAFAKKLTEAEKDGVWLYDGSWSSQEYGYNLVSVYTGMDAGYFSTDYRMAKAAAENHLEFSSQREQNTAYRQEALQTLLHIWICGICIFLILMLILLNIEMLHGLTRKRDFALLQAIGMSRRQLCIRLAAKSLLVSLCSCLVGHAGYFLFFLIKHIGTYHRFTAELEYTGTFANLLKDQFEASYLQAGWSLPVHLACCIFGMACVFLLSFGSQTRVLKGTIRENMV